MSELELIEDMPLSEKINGYFASFWVDSTGVEPFYRLISELFPEEMPSAAQKIGVRKFTRLGGLINEALPEWHYVNTMGEEISKYTYAGQPVPESITHAVVKTSSREITVPELDPEQLHKIMVLDDMDFYLVCETLRWTVDQVRNMPLGEFLSVREAAKSFLVGLDIAL